MPRDWTVQRRINIGEEDMLTEEKAGFRARRIIAQVFSLSKLVDRRWKKEKKKYILPVQDFKQAFNSV